MQKENSLHLEKIYNAPINIVWKAISDKTEMKKWYFDFSEGFKLEAGSEFDWYGGPPDGKQWHHRGKMLEIIDGKKLVHTWEYPGYTGTSTIIWELVAIDKSTTKLLFTQRFDVPFDPKEEALRRENFVEGWNNIININLVEFLEKQNQ